MSGVPSRPGLPAAVPTVPLIDGTLPTPGGWNRFAIEVADLGDAVGRLRQAGVHLRSDPIIGVGGKQVVIDDPSGNPVELFEPTRPEARLTSR
jgi:catechol 2,3-dioxygenase-like lactoylglutathione lyase family enzyme